MMTDKRTALYRRALAFEGAAFRFDESSESDEPLDSLWVSSKEMQIDFFATAMKDLRLCLSKLKQFDTSSIDKGRMLKSSQIALSRIEAHYTNLTTGGEVTKVIPTPPSSQTSRDMSKHLDQHNRLNGDISSNVSAATAPPQRQQLLESPKVPSPPDKTTQKKIVQKLLLNRQQIAVEKRSTPPTGEAFFLVDWNWWCHWAWHVDFFYTNEFSDSKSNQGKNRLQDNPRAIEKIKMVLNMLPPGAVLPPVNPARRHAVDSMSTGSDDDTDSDEDDQLPTGPPGVIDNSRLLFVESPSSKIPQFFRHWYDTTSLRPNLVRGHHFELLPREVYMALRSWYREATPSICRRTNDEGVVTLYPATSDKTAHLRSGKTAPQQCSACRAPHAHCRCTRCFSVHYCERSCQEAHWPFHKLVCKSLTNNGGSNHKSNADRFAGCVGLNNLGNTCFMNSALQCLSHATPLTRHFLSNQFKADLNSSNPLGTGGKLANAYDIVMKDLWMKYAKGLSTSPTSLKRAIALFAPRFAGCLQHDAQEFLAYLLDGLHEDLNRIRKAPYVEMPDVTDGQNMAIAGAEAWDAHRRRNDSLVMDTFYGQFKSTCVCPKCDRLSVSFDAFNHVSLEIPQTQNMAMTLPILLFQRNFAKMDAKRPLRCAVTVPRNSLVGDLRRELAELGRVPEDELKICDVDENAIHALFEDDKPVASMNYDMLVAYQVDAYTSASIHVIATHYASATVLNSAFTGNSGTNGDIAPEDQRRPFGLPFMTSFDADLTCRQVWDHIWNLVDHMVVESGSFAGFVDCRGQFRREDVLKLHVVDNNGKPRAVFGDVNMTAVDENYEYSEDESNSLIPSDSDDKIRSYLGSDCRESFLFISLQWYQPPINLPGAEQQAVPHDPNQGRFLIQPKRFEAFRVHPSFTEAVQKRRSGNSNKGVSLDLCFEAFTKPERLDENNTWYCARCKEHVRAMKTMKLWRLPNILVVHLKRFEFRHAFRRDKLDTFVDFPLEGLDMTPHCADHASSNGDACGDFVESAVPAEYDLFAVVNHFGRMGFGHYTAYARKWDERGLSPEWFYFDDSKVDIAGDGREGRTVVTPAAYVLFYRRRTFN